MAPAASLGQSMSHLYSRRSRRCILESIVRLPSGEVTTIEPDELDTMAHPRSMRTSVPLRKLYGVYERADGAVNSR